MKNIIITGTSRGIGYELVRLFADKGHQILALSRNDKPIKDLSLQNVHTFSCDLSKPENYKKVDAFIKTEWKQVDILINNA